MLEDYRLAVSVMVTHQGHCTRTVSERFDHTGRIRPSIWDVPDRNAFVVFGQSGLIQKLQEL